MTALPDPATPLVEKDGRLNRNWVDFITKQVTTLETLDSGASLSEVITAHNALITALKNAKVMK